MIVNKLAAGRRVNYRCNLMQFRGKQCASGLYLLCDSQNTDVHLYRADSTPHTHDDDNIKGSAVDRISGDVEAEIRSFLKSKVSE